MALITPLDLYIHDGNLDYEKLVLDDFFQFSTGCRPLDIQEYYIRVSRHQTVLIFMMRVERNPTY